MRDILFTGHIGALTEEFYSQLTDNYRVVVVNFGASQINRKNSSHKRLIHYDMQAQAESFEQLFSVYSFDTVVFVSDFIDSDTQCVSQQEELDTVLRSAVKAGVEKSILITGGAGRAHTDSSWAFEADRAAEFGSSWLLRMAQQEALCQLYADAHQLKNIILRVPYLVDEQNDTSALGRLFAALSAGNKIELPYTVESFVDFVSQKDLGRLVSDVINEPDDISATYDVASGYRCTADTFKALLLSLNLSVTVTYGDALTQEIPAYPTDLRRGYGWIPYDQMLPQIPGLYERYCKNHAPHEASLWQKAKAFLLSSSRLTKYLELIILLIIVELANAALGSNLYFRYVDLRLLYVVVMGTIHGTRTGLTAAILACLALLTSNIFAGNDLATILLNVENWLPFALYVLVGAVCGYVTDKKSEEIAFSHKEYDVLREKYLFLNDVYHSTVDNKNQYKQQIVGFDDSFGRIFGIVQQLDDVVPQKLLQRSLVVMEDLLQNKHIAIYSIDESKVFGRLMICSQSLKASLSKSIRLSDYASVLSAVDQRELYQNLDFEEGLPAYAYGVYRANRLELLVCVQECSSDQYSMRFMNLVRIICGLLQMSFQRALEYTELAREDVYVEHTDVLTPQRFSAVLLTRRQMREAGVADFLLLKFPNLSIQDAQNKLVPKVRVADEVGLGPDGSICAILAQATPETLPIISQRFESAGLAFTLVEDRV